MSTADPTKTGAVASKPPDDRPRCAWGGAWLDPLMVAHHDEEWGLPSRDERHLFELLTLEGAQAGLSWTTILHKRDGYRAAFVGFDPDEVAGYVPADVERLLEYPGIVRHRGKIEATIANAQAVLALRDGGPGLVEHLWSFVGGRPKLNRFESLDELPAQTPESTAMSRDLKRRGFGFVGPTTCYSFMQSAGLVNDHVLSCFRWSEVQHPLPRHP